MTLDVIAMRLLTILACSSLAVSGMRAAELDTLANDMLLPYDAPPHGVPSSFSWYRMTPQYPDRIPPVPAVKQAIIAWGQVYAIAAEDNAAQYNVRVHLRNMKTYVLLSSTNQWNLMNSQASCPGACFVEDFANNASTGVDSRGNGADGGTEVRMKNGYNYHFFPDHRVSIDQPDVHAVCTVVEARLEIDNPGGPDDRSRASGRFMINMGADWWLNTTTGWLPDWSANGGVDGGRFKSVTDQWQRYYMHTLSEAHIRANPPPLPAGPATPTPAANVAPAVVVTSPAAGAAVPVGATVTIQAAATDSDGAVAKVEFLVDGAVVGTDASAPFAAVWTATSGAHTLSARATDDAGASAVSSGVPVTVAATLPAGGGPAGYAYAADEGASFAISGTADVAYGADGRFAYSGSRTGIVTFSNAVFGDPAPGVFKRGYYRTVSSSNGAPAGYTYAGAENARFAIPGSADLAYGANGRFAYRLDQSGSVVFDNATFGDPLPGVAKQGYYRSTAATAPATTGIASWVAATIGTATAGSAVDAGGTVTVQGSGADIWGTADGCEFFGTTVAGDGELVARVDSLSATDAWAKAGVMLRASTAPGAVQAFACLTPGNGVAYQRRYLSGGPSSGTAGAAVAAPYWVKLVRTGSTIQAYQASDGATWVLIRSDTVDFGATVLVGLAVTSHSDGRSATGVFSHIGSTFAPVAAN